MNGKTRGIVGLISSLGLTIFGTYHILYEASQTNWTYWLLAVGGFIGFIGGLWELRKFTAEEN